MPPAPPGCEKRARKASGCVRGACDRRAQRHGSRTHLLPLLLLLLLLLLHGHWRDLLLPGLRLPLLLHGLRKAGGAMVSCVRSLAQHMRPGAELAHLLLVLLRRHLPGARRRRALHGLLHGLLLHDADGRDHDLLLRLHGGE